MKDQKICSEQHERIRRWAWLRGYLGVEYSSARPLDGRLTMIYGFSESSRIVLENQTSQQNLTGKKTTEVYPVCWQPIWAMKVDSHELYLKCHLELTPQGGLIQRIDVMPTWSGWWISPRSRISDFTMSWGSKNEGPVHSTRLCEISSSPMAPAEVP